MDYYLDMFNYSINWFLQNMRIFVLLGFSLIYICITEKNKVVKGICIWVPIISFILVIINPAVFLILGKQMYISGRWQRLLWTIPNTCVLAFAAAKAVTSVSKKKNRYILFMVIALSLLAFGDTKWRDESSRISTGIYGIPDQIIEVAEIINQDNFVGKKVIATDEVSNLIRLYDPEIQLFYTQEGYMRVTPDTVMFDNINSDKPDITTVVSLAEQYNFNHIVFHKNTVIESELNQYSYYMIGQTEDYVIYRLDDSRLKNNN